MSKREPKPRKPRRFPADVLTWRMCPKCWFKRAVDPDNPKPCPMCGHETKESTE